MRTEQNRINWSQSDISFWYLTLLFALHIALILLYIFIQYILLYFIIFGVSMPALHLQGWGFSCFHVLSVIQGFPPQEQ